MRHAEIRAKSIEKQHSALRADKYRIIVMFDDERKTFNFGKGRGENGEEEFYTFDELLKYQAKLAQLNANGGNIFITPFSDTYDYIFVDDLFGAKKDRFLKAGFEPCLLQTSSPYNHQAVLRIDKGQHGHGTLNRYFREINAKFGDPKIAGQVHPFRLAGFTNRKEKHKTERGFPFVKVVATKDITCDKAAAELESVAKRVEAETADGPLLKPLSRRQPNSDKLQILSEIYRWMKKTRPPRLSPPGTRLSPPGTRLRRSRWRTGRSRWRTGESDVGQEQEELPDRPRPPRLSESDVGQVDRRFAAYVLVGRNADTVDIEQFLDHQIRERYPDKTERTRYIQTVIYEAGLDFFREQQQMYTSRYRDPGLDLALDRNRVDWQAGKDMIMRGFSPAQVERYILETADRHHDPHDYARRTVVNFFASQDKEYRFKSPLHRNLKLINTEVDFDVNFSDKSTFNDAIGRELYPGKEKPRNDDDLPDIALARPPSASPQACAGRAQSRRAGSAPERTFKRNIHAPAPV